MSTDDGMQEFQNEFLIEAGFLIEQCEESFLHLEKGEDKDAELAKIYRVIHTLKGAGAAVGFRDIAEFTHVVEDALSVLRVSSYLFDSEVISLLLKVGDALKKRIQALSVGDRSTWEVTDLLVEVKSLREFLKERSETVVATSVENPANVEAEVQPSKEKVKAASAATSSAIVKVDTERIENVMDAVGELVVIKSQLITELENAMAQNAKLGGIISLLDRTIRELQDRALSMRMTPLKGTFLKLQRIVRDLSVKLGKPVEFMMEGEDVEMDRTMVEVIADPLMHLIRNSLDHGVETPEVRRERGKPEKGTIQLKARMAGSRVLIQVQDDGSGIQREKIMAKALEKGLVSTLTEAQSLSETEVYALLFAPGFSTAERVSDVSGRGVGMDVVKTNIEKLRGSIHIESTLGQGTLFTISLPITTSITEGLLVDINNNPYLLPIDSIIEFVDVHQAQLIKLHPSQYRLQLRGASLPLLDLREVFGQEVTHQQDSVKAKSKAIIVIETQGETMAVLINKVYGPTQVVQKPLSSYIEADVAGLCGAAILGDGRVALVIDVEGLPQMGTAA